MAARFVREIARDQRIPIATYLPRPLSNFLHCTSSTSINDFFDSKMGMGRIQITTCEL